ncbi:MAG: hypothetical protein H0U74_23575 [Bradymonadaceae bacterium]|nr:hypothetical protein [Lujinxingiaceae bacterium]
MDVLAKSKYLVIVLTVFVGFMAFGEPAFANPAARYKQQIEQFKTMLEEQKQADTKGVSEKDRALTEKWLQESEVLLANGNGEATGRRLRRVEYALDLIRAMVAASNIDALAQQQEENFHSSGEQINAFEVEITELQRKKETLNQELQRVRQ